MSLLVAHGKGIPRESSEPRNRRRVAKPRGWCDRAGPQQGRGAAGVRAGTAPSPREPCPPPGRMARFPACRRRFRLAAAHEQKGDVRGGDPVPGAWDGRLHIGLPADRRTAAAPFAGIPSGASIQRGFCGGGRGCAGIDVRQLLVSDVPPDARSGEAASRVGSGLVCRPDRSDLRTRRGDGEGVPAVRFGLVVRFVRTAPFARETTDRIRRRHTGRIPRRDPVARLLDAPLRAGPQRDRADFPHG